MDVVTTSKAVGISMGTTLAIVISFTRSRSIPGAIFAGIFGWVYVIYAAIRGDYGFEYDPLPPTLPPKGDPKK